MLQLSKIHPDECVSRGSNWDYAIVQIAENDRPQPSKFAVKLSDDRTRFCCFLPRERSETEFHRTRRQVRG